MHPVITASVPLLEPPGWAIAQRELFDLLDHAWRRFARDFTGPGRAAALHGRLTSRDGVDDFYETFFNWPQLYLLGGADDLLAASERHWEGVTRQLTELGMLQRRVRARLRLVPPGREPAAALLPVHGRPRALGRAGAAVRGALRRPGARQLRPRPPHHPPAAQRQRPRTRRAFRRRRPTRGCPRKPRCTASRWTGCCRPAPRARRRPRPAAGRGDAPPDGHRRHRGQPGRVRAGAQRPGPVRRAALPGLDRRRTSARGGSAPAANGGILPDNVAPGRHGRRAAGGPLVRRALRLVVAARLVQRRARRDGRRPWPGPSPPATTPSWTWCAPRWTRSSPTARSWPSPRRTPACGPSGASNWPRTCTPRPLHVPFRHGDQGWFDYNPMLMAVPDRPVAPHRLRRRPGAHRAAARGRRLRLAHRTGVPQQGGGRPRRALVRLPRRRRPGLSRSGSSPPRRPRSATAWPAWSATAAGTCRRPTSTCGSSRTRWSPRRWSSSPGAARRSSTTAVSSRPACATTTPTPGGPACRRRWPRWSPASTRRRPSSTWSTSTRRPTRSVIVQAGAFAEHTIRDGPPHRLRRTLMDRRPVRLRARPTGRDVGIDVASDGPWLLVELPRSTSVRLTLRLDLRTRPPSYRTPFEDDTPGDAP